MNQTIVPTFSGEFQFRRYSDTSTQGQQVVFAVSDRDALESFIGMEGKRFAAVLVQIGDDEAAVAPVEKERKEPIGDLCKWAVLRCKEREFFDFIRPIYDKSMGGMGLGTGDIEIGRDVKDEAEFCAHAIKLLCGIESRRELDTDKAAAERFKTLILRPWQKYWMAAGGVR
jgi:hypothetical protein